nr:hypothetical protein [Nonomuraea mesophila]
MARALHPYSGGLVLATKGGVVRTGPNPSLHRSPVMLPTPGTGSLAHLEDNLGAADVSLTADDLAALDRLAA